MGVVNSLMFHPPKPTYNKDSFRMFYVPSQQDTTIATRMKHIPCLYVEHSNPKHLLIQFHGNACDLGGIEPLMRKYSEEIEASIVAVEYPGYGIFPGSASESSVNQVARDVFWFLLEHGVKATDMILIGHSIGSGPASYLASYMCQIYQPPKALVLVAGYSSISDIGRDMTRIPGLAGNIWNNEAEMKHITCDVCFIHGFKDTVIPPAHSKRLYAACETLLERSKVFIELSWDHDMIYMDMGKCIRGRYDATHPQLHIPKEYFEYQEPEPDSCYLM